MKTRPWQAAGPLLVFGWAVVHMLTADASPSAPRSEAPPRNPPPAVAHPDFAYAVAAKRLLSDLDVGDDLGGWKVVGARGPVDRAILVEAERDGARITIMVVRSGVWPQRAILHTDRFDLYYTPPPPDAGLTFEDAKPALDALQVRVDRYVPIPEGM